MVTDHLRIINEQIRDDVQCCDYLLNEDFCKISVCVCACVCMCVWEGCLYVWLGLFSDAHLIK